MEQLAASPTFSALGHPPEYWNALEQEGEEIAAIEVRVDAALYRQLTLIRDFDEKTGWARQGAKTMAHWLMWRLQLSGSAARERVRVARALAALPKIDEALQRAEISYSQARAITRVADEDTEDFLLNIARYGTAAQLEATCSKYRSYERMLTHEERLKSAWLEVTTVSGGGGIEHLEFAGPRDQVERVVEALDRVAEVLDVVDKADDPAVKPLSEHRKLSDEDDLEERRRIVHERGIGYHRAQALIALADMVLHGVVPLLARPTHEILVQVDADVLAGTRPGSGVLEDGTRICFDKIRRLCCDEPIVPVTVQDGQVLDVGRRTRAIPSAIRRALHVRDDGCRFPGCGTHRKLHGHHIQHWAEGGETSLENLIHLCSHHHTLVHEGGFRVEGTGTEPRFYSPNGTSIPPAPRRPPLDPEALEKWVGREALGEEMGARYPRWDGTRPEYHIWIGMMLTDKELGRKRRAAQAIGQPADTPSSLTVLHS